jgi:hypothetical protein
VKSIEEMLTQPNIWNSPLFATLKVFKKEKVKDKIYFYIDFKKINKKIKVVEYIISTIVELFVRMCRVKIFSELDLAIMFYIRIKILEVVRFHITK